MEQIRKTGHDRRSFLRNAGLGSSVLALGPLLASVGATNAQAAPMKDGKYDFDTPYNRIGWNNVKWDGSIAEYHMSHIVAGLGIADMDFRCAPSITEALKKRVAHENWGYFDMGLSRGKAFRKGIIDWNRRRYGITNMHEGNLGIATGVHPGILACLRNYAPPGTKVLMATPIYNGFYGDIKHSKTIANESLMKWVNGRYEIDWQDFENRMTPDTHVSILCNPQNPVGRVWSREELTHYGELCLKHNILVIADEIHCDFVTKGNKYTPFSTLDNKDVVNNSISLKSGSKTFSISGQMCGWFYSTNPEVFKRTSFENHADLNELGMIAEEAAYAGGEEWANQLVDYIDGNQQYVHDYIRSNIPMIKVGNKPEGTYLHWLDCSQIEDRIGAKKKAEQANQMMREQASKLGENYMGIRGIVGARQITPEDIVTRWFAKNAYVMIEQGSKFGKGSEGHMRFNTATSRKTLTAALDSMARALKKLA